jgi:hypothetical protein
MGARIIPEAIASKPVAPLAAVVGRRIRRGRERRSRRDLAPTLPLAEPMAPPAPDPVRLAVLAMESLGRASLRASFTGTEVQVAVPDAETAAIFQAAIAETSRSRSTDRLIRIVVA